MDHRENRLIVRYQYNANKRKYFLGIRVRLVKRALLLFLFLFIVMRFWVLMVILLWILIGYLIDMKQRKMTRDYMESVIAWYKFNRLEISDIDGGGVIHKIFRNVKN